MSTSSEESVSLDDEQQDLRKTLLEIQSQLKEQGRKLISLEERWKGGSSSAGEKENLNIILSKEKTPSDKKRVIKEWVPWGFFLLYC